MIIEPFPNLILSTPMKLDSTHRAVLAAVFFLAVGFSPLIADAIESLFRRRRRGGYKSL